MVIMERLVPGHIATHCSTPMNRACRGERSYTSISVFRQGWGAESRPSRHMSMPIMYSPPNVARTGWATCPIGVGGTM